MPEAGSEEVLASPAVALQVANVVISTDIQEPAAATKSAPKKRRAAKQPEMAALEKRLREEVGNFEFSALISGISTISQPGIAQNKTSESRLPSPNIEIAREEQAPVPGLPGIYSRSPAAPLGGASVSDLPLPAMAAATVGKMAGGPLDSARAYSDYAHSRGVTPAGVAKPMAGWTYRTKRSHDFGSVVAIILIAVAVC